MYVYLDESGDTGFKFRNGSSRYFVIALLLVDDPLPLHQAVHDLRLRLNKSESYEFKFMRTHHDGRIAFFQAIKSFTFQVYALVVDKMNLESPTQWTKESLYNSLVKL